MLRMRRAIWTADFRGGALRVTGDATPLSVGERVGREGYDEGSRHGFNNLDMSPLASRSTATPCQRHVTVVAWFADECVSGSARSQPRPRVRRACSRT